MERAASKLFADPSTCGDCTRPVPANAFLTEVNPPGGYGRVQLLVCDGCMESGRWEDWKAKHWQNWPSEPRFCLYATAPTPPLESPLTWPKGWKS